jgi:hypothetical protein
MSSDEIEPTLDPSAQRFVAGDASAAHVHHADHRAPGEIKRSNMRLRQKLIEPFRAYFDDQIIFENTAAHPTVDHERHAAEHLLFLDRGLVGQGYAKTDG